MFDMFLFEDGDGFYAFCLGGIKKTPIKITSFSSGPFVFIYGNKKESVVSESEFCDFVNNYKATFDAVAVCTYCVIKLFKKLRGKAKNIDSLLKDVMAEAKSETFKMLSIIDPATQNKVCDNKSIELLSKIQKIVFNNDCKEKIRTDAIKSIAYAKVCYANTEKTEKKDHNLIDSVTILPVDTDTDATTVETAAVETTAAETTAAETAAAETAAVETTAAETTPVTTEADAAEPDAVTESSCFQALFNDIREGRECEGVINNDIEEDSFDDDIPKVLPDNEPHQRDSGLLGAAEEMIK